MLRKGWKCRLFGCRDDGFGPCCERCGGYYYEDFIFFEECLLFPVFNLYRTAKAHIKAPFQKIHRTCGHCERSMWFTKQEFCSKQCEEEWFPF